MVVVHTLVTLAAQKAISDHRSLRSNAAFLPKAVLESLLASSVTQRKILALRELLCQWPFKQLLLQDVGNEFDELHAVLFAFTLQKANNKLEIIDLRGCRTGRYCICYIINHIFIILIMNVLKRTYQPVQIMEIFNAFLFNA